MGLNLDEQKAVERFKKDVVEPSMTNLVILDFYADWCGPCKAIAPMLEKVAAEYADKGVVLKKVDVDQEKFIASQFQVQSIPTIYAMFQGQPVADLTKARSESQLKQTLDQILSQLPIGDGAQGGEQQQDIGPLVEMGEEVLAGGDAERAAGIFAQIVEMKPDSAAAQGGLIRALALAGHKDKAQAALDAVPLEIAEDPAIAQAKSAIELAGEEVDSGELDAARSAAEAGGAQEKFDYAEKAFAAGDRDAAADTLLSIVRDEPEWNEGAAKAKLLQIFEAVGLEDPWVADKRRQLSLILFG
ncbi:MAG: co-chaperone YbbN [Sphingomonadales bacterium CG12_big_fil_rev_8_21_14_0_65_65_10]|uniref:tetratricopeptide repeat protein n=1 Tax=Blastomonas marina TaxID=1867408 RepID=UPI000CA7625F|nr:tetratricopeptide repeat protein [Blastomonas marina]PIW55852.1 MAG: co-chaperone YbbN [Sphingomonadales bacterium CG12_big_fil_rev_8_21_14_0_65_65_10]WPZ05364.1 tetratricopeptide repeat protein [Blastomonas marina]